MATLTTADIDTSDNHVQPYLVCAWVLVQGLVHHRDHHYLSYYLTEIHTLARFDHYSHRNTQWEAQKVVPVLESDSHTPLGHLAVPFAAGIFRCNFGLDSWNSFRPIYITTSYNMNLK
jgi:hypothetical protein